MIYFLKADLRSLAKWCPEPIKIGVADDLEERLSNIQGMNAAEIECLNTIRGDRELERYLHKRFKNLRIPGGGREWFRPSKELLEIIRPGEI